MGWGQHPAMLDFDFSVGFTDSASPLGTDMPLEIADTVRVLEASRRGGIPIYFSTIDQLRRGGHRRYRHVGSEDSCPWVFANSEFGR